MFTDQTVAVVCCMLYEVICAKKKDYARGEYVVIAYTCVVSSFNVEVSVCGQTGTTVDSGY